MTIYKIEELERHYQHLFFSVFAIYSPPTNLNPAFTCRVQNFTLLSQWDLESLFFLSSYKGL